jgi:DnaK suppressor protein
MEAKDLERFRKKLLKLKEELAKILENQDDLSTSNDSIDELDQATELIEKMTGFALSSNLRSNMKEVKDALVRIEQKNYGQCENCEKDIPPKRLEVLPFTKFCIDCQRERERL